MIDKQHIEQLVWTVREDYPGGFEAETVLGKYAVASYDGLWTAFRNGNVAIEVELSSADRAKAVSQEDFNHRRASTLVVDELGGHRMGGKVAPADIYRILKKHQQNGTLSGDHMSSLSREIASLFAGYPASPKPGVKKLEWVTNGDGFRGIGPLIYDVYPDKDGGWWAALSMAGYLPYRERATNPDEARVAAQCDFERRILDGIEEASFDAPVGWRSMDTVVKEHGSKIIGSYDEGACEIIQPLYYSTFDYQWRRKLDGAVVPEPKAWMPYPKSRHDTP